LIITKSNDGELTDFAIGTINTPIAKTMRARPQ